MAWVINCNITEDNDQCIAYALERHQVGNIEFAHLSTAKLGEEKKDEQDSNLYHKIKDKNQQENTYDSLYDITCFDQWSERGRVNVQVKMR